MISQEAGGPLDSAVETAVAKFYLTNGVLGLSVLILLGVVYFLWRYAESKNVIIVKLYEDRLADQRTHQREWNEFQTKLIDEFEKRELRRTNGNGK